MSDSGATGDGDAALPPRRAAWDVLITANVVLGLGAGVVLSLARSTTTACRDRHC